MGMHRFHPRVSHLDAAVLVARCSTEAQQPEVCVLLPQQPHSLRRCSVTNSPAAMKRHQQAMWEESHASAQPSPAQPDAQPSLTGIPQHG